MNRVIGRKNGVTIDEEFYKVLESEAFLTSSHLLFFENVFFKYFYHCKKIFIADCYFFWEFMPSLSKQIPDNLIDFKKVEEIKKKMEIKNANNEAQNNTLMSQPILKGGSSYQNESKNTKKIDSQMSQQNSSQHSGGSQMIQSSINTSQQFNQTQNLQTQNLIQSNINQQKYQYNNSEISTQYQISQSQQLEKSSEYNPSIAQSNIQQQSNYGSKNNFIESNSKIGQNQVQFQNQQTQQNISHQFIQSNIISNNTLKQKQEQQQLEKIQEKKQQEQKPQMIFQIVSINVEQKEKELHAVQKLNELFKTQTLNKESNFLSNPIYNYEYAYFPINLENFHWISVIVYVKERKIIYADSLNGYNQGIIDGVRKILNFKKSPPIDNWVILRNTPQQQNGHDCGVFTLYNLYYLYQQSEEINKNSYSQQDISVFRKRLIRLTEAELTQKLDDKTVNSILSFDKQFSQQYK